MSEMITGLNRWLNLCRPSPAGQPDSWFLGVHDRCQREGMGMTGLGIVERVVK